MVRFLPRQRPLLHCLSSRAPPWSVDNEVLVEKSPHLLLGLNLSSRSPQVDPTESFDVWTVALQDGPDVHTALSYAMHAPEQRYHLFEHSSKDIIWMN